MLKGLKYALLLHLLPPVAYLFLVILRATLTITQVNREPVDRLWQQGGEYHRLLLAWQTARHAFCL